jgi:hypothetical protein
MKKLTILIFVLSTVLFCDCVRSSKNCKENAKKMKKNNIGWKY